MTSFPGPKLPSLWQTTEWLLNPINFMERHQKIYGNIFTIKITGWATHVLVADPDFLKKIVNSSSDKLITGRSNKIMRPILGNNSLFVMDGDGHTKIRRLLINSLSRERILTAIDQASDLVEEIIRIRNNEENGQVSIRPLILEITLAYVLTVICGVRTPQEIINLAKKFHTVLGTMATTRSFYEIWNINRLFLMPQSWPNKPFNDLDESLKELVESAKPIAPGIPCAVNDLSKVVTSWTEMRDHVLTLISAGHDTTGTACQWGVRWLFHEPKILEQYKSAVTAGDLDFQRAVCDEALRLIPTVEVTSRVSDDPFEYGGKVIPAGHFITPCMHLAHRNPDVFSNPEAFLPQRFVDQKFKSWEFLPFGLGPRRCIGAVFAGYLIQTILKTIIVDHEAKVSTSARPVPIRNHMTIIPKGNVRAELKFGVAR